MRVITEAEVTRVLQTGAGMAALEQAFRQLGEGRAAVLPRSRAALSHEGAAFMISSMGAILADDGVCGTKVYSTRNGQFQFVITLFDLASGLPLATLEANELTRVRTATTTALAVRALAPTDAKVLAIFGAGIQARAHAQRLMATHRYDRVLVSARSGAQEFAADIGALAVDAETAVRQADVIVTATRAGEPLFDGQWVKPGALVAAVGSSKPSSRELDDALLSRAGRIVVEWLPAAQAEAGELVGAAPGVVTAERLQELGAVLIGPGRRGPDEIVVYKSVGIGLEDVALAHHVYQALQA